MPKWRLIGMTINIRPILLFSKEKLRKHVLRIVKHSEYWNFIFPPKFYTSQHKFLARPLL